MWQRAPIRLEHCENKRRAAGLLLAPGRRDARLKDRLDTAVLGLAPARAGVATRDRTDRRVQQFDRRFEPALIDLDHDAGFGMLDPGQALGQGQLRFERRQLRPLRSRGRRGR